MMIFIIKGVYTTESKCRYFDKGPKIVFKRGPREMFANL